LKAAGRRSLSVGDGNAAAKLLGRAVALVEPTGREGAEFLLDLATAHTSRGDLQAAQGRRAEAVELARTVGDRALELRAVCDLAQLRSTTDASFTADEALDLGREAVRELEAAGDEKALAAAWALVAMGENLRGTWLGVSSALEHMVEYARDAGDHRRQTEAMQLLSASIFWGPTPISAGLPRVEAIAQDVAGDRWLEAWAIRPVAGFYAMQGRFEEARELLARSGSALEELGRQLDVVTLAFWSGPLELLAGDFAAAERVLGKASDVLQAAGETGWLSTISAFRAQALYGLGSLEAAEEAVRLSRDAATSDDYNAQAFWRWGEAKLLARRGHFEEAERLGREAVAWIDRSDELNNSAEVRMGLVEVLRLADRPDDAREVLEEALARYEQKGNEVMTDRVRALLGDMSA
jgi:tetratricopeptide (TPR) repeat protein